MSIRPWNLRGLNGLAILDATLFGTVILSYDGCFLALYLGYLTMI